MNYFLKSLTTSSATASLWDNVFWACNFLAASKFLNSFAPAVIVCSGVFAVHHNVILGVHLVTWSGIINVTVETSGVTTARKRHAIHTAHLDKRNLWVQFIHNRNNRLWQPSWSDQKRAGHEQSYWELRPKDNSFARLPKILNRNTFNLYFYPAYITRKACFSVADCTSCLGGNPGIHVFDEIP